MLQILHAVSVYSGAYLGNPFGVGVTFQPKLNLKATELTNYQFSALEQEFTRVFCFLYRSHWGFNLLQYKNIRHHYMFLI